jgi:hypothetical protein
MYDQQHYLQNHSHNEQHERTKHHIGMTATIRLRNVTLTPLHLFVITFETYLEIKRKQSRLYTIKWSQVFQALAVMCFYPREIKF